MRVGLVCGRMTETLAIEGPVSDVAHSLAQPVAVAPNTEEVTTKGDLISVRTTTTIMTTTNTKASVTLPTLLTLARHQ